MKKITSVIIVALILIGLAYLLAPREPRELPAPAQSDAPSAHQDSSNAMQYAIQGLDAGFVSMVVAKHSPTLLEEEKRAISEDFYGAPNTLPASRYFVIAEELTCSRVKNSGSIVDCDITYPKNEKHFALDSDDSAKLFVILGGLQQGAPRDAIRVTQVNCSVDDMVVQTSPGNDIRGFDCDLIIEP